ncbi:MAG: hypothetical protein B6U78_02795 [Candidatus Aenigmarchaeota archaeon ex4484_224]|nr:MAG: hypothetical protein B6U78_02795 [Candidatus Aenigmarchaeota archaeon ex4484_224]
MIMRILGIIMLILLFSSLALSLEVTRKYCRNNTLVIERVGYWKVNNKVYNITKTEEIYCEFGCEEKGDNAYCLPPPEKASLYSFGILAGILILISVLYWWLK